MKLIDVNILVHAHRQDADRHQEITLWMERARERQGGIAVSDLILSSFIPIATHPKIFKTPTPLLQAIEFADELRKRHGVSVIAPRSRNWQIFTQLCTDADARGNHTPDAFHAALAIEYGIEFITLDRGFARFPNLRWRSP